MKKDKILVCLLSEQHMPNLLSVHHFRPDKLVLVETERMQRNSAASNFLRALEAGGLSYVDRTDVALLPSEDSLDSIRALLHESHQKYPSGEWIVNLTGGTKPMSIAAYEFFKEVTVPRLIYMNHAKPDAISDISDSSRQEICTHRPAIVEFLAGYGYELGKASKIIQRDERNANKWWSCSQVMAVHLEDGESVLKFNDEERKKARKNGCTLPVTDLAVSSSVVTEVLTETFNPNNQPNVSLDKHAVSFLTGGWLESFIWGLLNKNEAPLGVWDVRLGLEVKHQSSNAPNDYDVCYMHRHGLNMVECKSGMGHDRSFDVLYKIEAVIRQLRALKVRSSLVVMEDRIRDAAKTRAELYDCNIIARAQIRELAAAPTSIRLIQEVFRLD